ncbi:hypothetical protein NPIL_417751 [Nephila pilipes]|uniref:Uncharacterized protein n=1 Tax=Nephila pilipes TaxID=299642 RepID=A0A8X6N8H1_NEPPI|nr:hypothetical protein NPIL_417751 [Nephila pilipes]
MTSKVAIFNSPAGCKRGRSIRLSICQYARQSPDTVGGAITQGGRNCRMPFDDENDIRSDSFKFLKSWRVQWKISNNHQLLMCRYRT